MVAHAAGLIVFRVAGNFEYLMLQTVDGDREWSPPKGHIAEGENALAAAKRKAREEAGLAATDYEIFHGPGFPYHIQYPVLGEQRTVDYWLANLNHPDIPVHLSHHHSDFQWADVNQAKRLSHPFPNFQVLLDRIEAFLGHHFGLQH